MPLASVAAEKIYYVEHGARGAPIIFVHGAGSNHLIWGLQLRVLGAIGRAVALDLPGHSKSFGAGRATIDAYADIVVQFLDALKFERALIVGHSMGGAIAQMLALTYPTRVAGLALIGTGARLRVLPQFLDGTLTDFEKTCAQIARAQFARPDDAQIRKLEKQMRAGAPRVLHADFAACNAFDVMNRVGEIRAPTLVVCGRADAMTPVKYSEFLGAKIPGARLEIIANAGHAVMLEQPEELNRVLSEFAQKL